MRLHRPIGIWLLLWPTLWALWIASDGRPDQLVFLVLLAGTLVTRSAGCVINDYADRDFDGHVKRTADRPIATGEVKPREALLLFAGLMLAALGLVLALNRLALLFACVGALITVLYPFTKRFLSAPQSILGIAFAWGVPMAFAAQTESVPPIGWLIFAAAVVWGVLYDTEYAMVDRDDDMRIGVRSTAIMLGSMDRAFVAFLQIVVLTLLLIVGQRSNLNAWYYGGLTVAAVLSIYQQYLIKDRERDPCFRAFLNNAWVGGFVYAGLVFAYVFR